MTEYCFEPTDHNIKKTDLKAIGGSKLRYEFSEEVFYCNVKELVQDQEIYNKKIWKIK